MENTKKGFIPVMLTPFRENGEVDYKTLSALTEMYLHAGSAGLFANCLSSEMFELNEEEMLTSIEQVVKVSNGSVPVVATGAFGGKIAKQADFIKRVYDIGVQAVIIITSLIAEESESDDVFNERVIKLIDATPGIPLGFYECPVPYKRLLSAQQLQLFGGTGRIIYHKDTCLDIVQIKEKLAVTRNSSFALYDAYMGHAVASLQAGSAGLSCIQGNYFPELIVWLCNNYDNDSCRDDVQKVQQFLISNMDVMHEVYPVVSKYFLNKRGFPISTFTRRKVGDFTSSIISDIENLYQDCSRLQSHLEIGDPVRW